MIIVRIFTSISFCNEFLVVLNWPFLIFSSMTCLYGIACKKMIGRRMAGESY